MSRIEKIRLNGTSYAVGEDLTLLKQVVHDTAQSVLELETNVEAVNDDVESLQTWQTTVNDQLSAILERLTAIEGILDGDIDCGIIP